MHVIYARADLNEEIECRVLAEVLLLPNEIEEVALARILEGQVNCVLVLEAGVQSANVLVIQLLLNSDFSNQRLFYLTARQRSFLNLLHGDHDSGGLVLGELHLAVGALAEVGIARLNEFQVFFRDVLEDALELSLFGGQSAFIIAILDKWRASLNSLALGEEHGITRLRILPRALVLMQLEPVLLKTSL